MSPSVFCVLQGYGWAGAVSNHHDSILQGSDGRSNTACAKHKPKGAALTIKAAGL